MEVDTDPAEEELAVSEGVGDPTVASGSVLETLIAIDIVAENMTTSEAEMEAVLVSETSVAVGWADVFVEIVGGEDTDSKQGDKHGCGLGRFRGREGGGSLV